MVIFQDKLTRFHGAAGRGLPGRPCVFSPASANSWLFPTTNVCLRIHALALRFLVDAQDLATAKVTVTIETAPDLCPPSTTRTEATPHQVTSLPHTISPCRIPTVPFSDRLPTGFGGDSRGSAGPAARRLLASASAAAGGHGGSGHRGEGGRGARGGEAAPAPGAPLLHRIHQI